MSESKHNGNEQDGGGSGPVDHMRYDLLTQAALRQVVRWALQRVEREGLPGEHHFFIAFDTRHPDVVLSDRLRARYPEEMTIVLQHQFWNLKVHASGFEVGLSFGGVPEKLVIPFEAVKGFFDPSVQFGLQFAPTWQDEAESAAEKRALSTEPHERGSDTASSGSSAVTGQETTMGDGEKTDGETPEDASKVVSIDAFRRK